MSSTPTRPSTKRFSLASSAGQPRPSVHFDDQTIISRPEIIDASLKRRLSVMASHPHKSSSPETHRHHHRQQSTPTNLASYPKTYNDPIQMTPPPKNKHNSPHRRSHSIPLPLTTTSIPDIYPTNPISPRKRRFSTTLHDPAHDSNTSTPSPRKRRFSGVSPSSEDKLQHVIIDPSSSSSSSFPRTRRLSILPPSINKPPPQVSAQINQRIRSTFHSYPNFDFVQHVQHRSYVVRTQHFEETESVTMLDIGVDTLLQRMFENLPRQPDTNKNIDIRSSPGKGLGMFSRKEIANGEAFLFEYPTVIAPYVVGLSVGLSQLYADIFSRLSGPVSTQVMDLSSTSSLISGEIKKEVHEAIMRINALAIELPVPDGEFPELQAHRAIFLQTSRCNHRCVSKLFLFPPIFSLSHQIFFFSCGPNARWEWDLKRFSLVLTAVRPIQEGEEITIPYVALNTHSKERQEILSNFYGFQCLCSFCIPPSPPHDDDDDDMTALSPTWIKGNSESTSSLPSFEKWCLDPTLPDDILINSHLHAIHYLQQQQQGLHIPDTAAHDTLIRHLDTIAMCYGALEDAVNFRIWMERVCEERLRKRWEHELVFKKWLSNPTTFPVWGWRRVFCGKVGERDGESESDGDGDDGLSACVRMGMF